MQTIPSTKQQIIEELNRLSVHDQEKVLAFIRTLPHLPVGISGKELVDFFRQFSFTDEEAKHINEIFDEMS